MLIQLLRQLIANRKRVLLALAIVGLVGLFVYTRLAGNSSSTQTEQIVDPKKNYRELTPGKSTHQDIIEHLGEPQSAYELQGKTVYVYPSTTSYYTPDQLYVTNDVLQLKELFYTPEQFSYTVTRLTEEFGKPDKVLYQPFNPYMENYVYVYPDQGVAAYITKENKVFKLHYFVPSDLPTYRQTWAKDLIDDKPNTPKTADQHSRN